MRQQNDKYVFEHDLKDIFKQVWGYNAFPFFFSAANKVENALFGKKKSDESDFDFGETIERREYNMNGVSFYGNNNNGNEVFLPIWLIRPDGSRLLLQNTVSDFSNKKTIVETPLVNRKGTVKEEISISDWEINVKGIIVSADFDYPDEQVSELNELYESDDSLGIENARSSLVLGGNEMVVIKSLRFPELKGMKNVQPFEMNLVSDLEFDLIIG